MPKGIHNTPRGRKKTHSPAMVRLPIEVNNGLTYKEKQSVLIDAHAEKMRNLDEWCAKMLNKLNSK